MKKLLLLLLLIPSLVTARVCEIVEKSNEDAYDKLIKCETGQQLFFRKLTDGSQYEIDEAKYLLIWRRSNWCDLRYEASIDQVKTGLYLTCIFRNHYQD